MKDWETAQYMVAQQVGGKITPGSGNGRQKGDVINDEWMFEVKQTDKKQMTVKRTWFNKIIKQAKDKNPCFVIFFELRGYPYILESSSIAFSEPDWSTCNLKEDDLPQYIISHKTQIWKLISWTQLKEL